MVPVTSLYLLVAVHNGIRNTNYDLIRSGVTKLLSSFFIVRENVKHTPCSCTYAEISGVGTCIELYHFGEDSRCIFTLERRVSGISSINTLIARVCSADSDKFNLSEVLDFHYSVYF